MPDPTLDAAAIKAQIEEYWGPEEDLHPDLVPYLVESSFGQALKHPLVFDVPYTPRSNHRLNYWYQYKLDRIREVIAERNYGAVIYLYERPYRLDAFHQIADHLTDEEYWALLADTWIDSENIWQNREEWGEVLAGRPNSHLFMDEEDREKLAKLPDPIPVYRGAAAGVNDDGLSWTTDVRRAIWFANRLRRPDEQRVLVVGEVAHADVIGYLTGRGEDEIVVQNPDVVVVHRIEEVPEDG